MAKVCKFCNHDNEEELEFCEQCGAKLPVFHRLVVDENRKPKKHIKINYFYVFLVIFVLFLLYCIYLAFCPFLPEDKLPEYDKSIMGAKRIISSIRHIPDDEKHFHVSLYALPDDISLYLSSLAKPALLEREHYKEDIVPRLLIEFPEDDPKEFCLIHRGNIWGMETRAEFLFKQHDNAEEWFIGSCKFGKLPMTWFSGTLLSSVLEDYARHSDMKKILKSKLELKRDNAYIKVRMTYDKKERFKQLKGFLSGLFNKSKEISKKATDKIIVYEK